MPCCRGLRPGRRRTRGSGRSCCAPCTPSRATRPCWGCGRLQELVHGVEDAFKRTPAPAALPLETLQRTAAALRRALEAAGGPEQEQAFAPLGPLRAELADALAAPRRPPCPRRPPPPRRSWTTRPRRSSRSSRPTPPAGKGRRRRIRRPRSMRKGESRSHPPRGTRVGTRRASAEAAPGPSSTPPVPPAAASASPAPSAAPEAGPAARTPAPERRSEAGAREESLRIPFARLDPLLSQVDDLSRAVEGLRAWMAENAQALQGAGLRRGAAERLEQLDASASAVRRGATALRLVPVERVFSRFPPVAADLARERGKRVRVELHGEGTELDKATPTRCWTPSCTWCATRWTTGWRRRRSAARRESRRRPSSACPPRRKATACASRWRTTGAGWTARRIERRARAAGPRAAEGEALEARKWTICSFAPASARGRRRTRCRGAAWGWTSCATRCSGCAARCAWRTATRAAPASSCSFR